jgi:hypothetical protein
MLVSALEKETLAAGFRFFSSHALLLAAVDRFGKVFKGVPISVASELIRGNPGVSGFEVGQEIARDVTSWDFRWVYAAPWQWC